jgi:hypothetical protein
LCEALCELKKNLAQTLKSLFSTSYKYFGQSSENKNKSSPPANSHTKSMEPSIPTSFSPEFHSNDPDQALLRSDERQREPQRFIGAIQNGSVGIRPLPPPVRFQRLGRRQQMQTAPRGPIISFRGSPISATSTGRSSDPVSSNLVGLTAVDQLELLWLFLDLSEDEDIVGWMQRIPDLPTGPSDDKDDETTSFCIDLAVE